VAFLKRAPDTATADDIFRMHFAQAGLPQSRDNDIVLMIIRIVQSKGAHGPERMLSPQELVLSLRPW
jgi:hypothetical protein